MISVNKNGSLGYPFLTHLVRNDLDLLPHRPHRLSRHRRLALPHVPLAEEELAVQVAGLDGVQVDLQQQEKQQRQQQQKGRARGAVTTIMCCIWQPPCGRREGRPASAERRRQRTTSICLNPVIASVFMSSQPMPPAPTASTRAAATCGCRAAGFNSVPSKPKELLGHNKRNQGSNCSAEQPGRMPSAPARAALAMSLPPANSAPACPSDPLVTESAGSLFLLRCLIKASDQQPP